MKWYKHATGSLTQNKKILKLKARLGSDFIKGYGLFHACLELIGAHLEPDSTECKLEWDENLLAAHVSISVCEVKKLMEALVEEDLLEYKDGSYRCPKMLERLDNTMMQSPSLKAALKNLKSLEPDKIRKDKTRKEEKKDPYAPSVRLTKTEYNKLVGLLGEKAARDCIMKLSDAKGAKGYRYKSDYRAIRNWVIGEITGHPTSYWEEERSKKKDVLQECPQCGKNLKNETRNHASHCYHCGAPIGGANEVPDKATDGS